MRKKQLPLESAEAKLQNKAKKLYIPKNFMEICENGNSKNA
jgi:hypothetical protein